MSNRRTQKNSFLTGNEGGYSQPELKFEFTGEDLAALKLIKQKAKLDGMDAPNAVSQWFYENIPALRPQSETDRLGLISDIGDQERSQERDDFLNRDRTKKMDEPEPEYGTPQGILEEYEDRDRTKKMDDDSTYGLLDEDYFSYLDKDREDYLLMHGEDIDKKRMESQDQDREDYLLRHGTDPEVSGGMTDNAFGGETDRKMSPKSQQYALGLLKDMMTPEQDDAPQQVRGAGIIKGSGTPFPSLLQKKPERQYYRNKGLV